MREAHTHSSLSPLSEEMRPSSSSSPHTRQQEERREERREEEKRGGKGVTNEGERVQVWGGCE
jgi:hypothetical protein